MRYIFIALLLVLTLPAHARANTPYDDECEAAYHTDDWIGVSVYCAKEAETLDLEAMQQSGELYFQTKNLEALCLIQAAQGEMHTYGKPMDKTCPVCATSTAKRSIGR